MVVRVGIASLDGKVDCCSAQSRCADDLPMSRRRHPSSTLVKLLDNVLQRGLWKRGRPRCILWRWVDELGPFCVSSSAGSMEGKAAPQSRGQRMTPGRAARQASRRIPRRWGYQSTLMETGDARRCGLDSKQCSFLLPLVVTQRCQEKIRCTSTNMRRIFLLLMQLRLFKRRLMSPHVSAAQCVQIDDFSGRGGGRGPLIRGTGFPRGQNPSIRGLHHPTFSLEKL